MLTPLVYTCLQLSCRLLLLLLIYFIYFLFASKFIKYGRNGGKEEEVGRATKIVHIFIHDCEECYGIQTLILEGEWEKIVILSVVYENIGCKKRIIRSQERMLCFVDGLLLGSWTEKKFRKRT